MAKATTTIVGANSTDARTAMTTSRRRERLIGAAEFTDRGHILSKVEVATNANALRNYTNYLSIPIGKLYLVLLIGDNSL